MIQNAAAEGDTIDHLDREGRTPLFYAIKDGLLTIASELIALSADVSLR